MSTRAELKEKYHDWLDEQKAIEERERAEIEEARKSRSCAVCDYPLVQKHRLIPGKLGGHYTWDNVAFLCPTHHRMAHLFKRVERRNEESDLDDVSDYDLDIFAHAINGGDEDFVEWHEENRDRFFPPVLLSRRGEE